MLIPCPYCGPRDLAEFTVLGAARPRPVFAAEALGDGDAVEAFTAHVYERDNPAGPQDEHWYHATCRSWLRVRRDTVSHAILSVAFASEPATGEAA